ncbi:hypothetical protein [Streptomyces sp. 067-1]|uniref:hypothetical protein n=1 Tax=Streptomyces sp. 067-1 TaxID=2789269 RepID=UPI0039F50C24
MSELAGPAGAEQTSSCCAAIAAWRQRAEQRTEQHVSGEGLMTPSPDAARDA